MPILDVPWVGQWGENASAYRADCGPACIRMLLEFFGKGADTTVDSLARETALADGRSGLMPYQLVTLAAKHDLVTVAAQLSPDQIMAEIDDGFPVIVLLANRYLVGRLDVNDNKPGSDGHYVIVIGYNADSDKVNGHFVINDPDYWAPYTSKGSDIYVPFTELEKAMSVYGNWAVMIAGGKMSAIDDALAITTNMRSELDHLDKIVKAYEAALAVPAPTPTPAPAPGDAKKGTVLEDHTHVRQNPSLTATIVDELKAGDIVFVVETSNITTGSQGIFHWMKITIGPRNTAGFYIAKETLSFM